jgi:DNA topoisomerase-3
METAGNKDYEPNSDIEKRGIGTPATRAGTIEKLIKGGYIKRDGKNLTATDKGVNLIKIVPESIKSAKLTAEWETELQKIAKGEADADSFMSNITAFTKVLVSVNSTACGESANVFKKPQEIISECPKCGGDILDTPRAYSCGERCGFRIWKEIAMKHIPKEQIKRLIEEGKTVKIKGFKSKAGKDFDAVLTLKSDFTVGFEF